MLGRQQLFTENTVTPILPLLTDRTVASLMRVIRLWAIVLVGNILATFVIASVLAHTDAFQPRCARPSPRSAATPSRTRFGRPSSRRCSRAGSSPDGLDPPGDGLAAPFIIILMTWLVSMCGLAHIVAGSVDAYYLVAIGEISFPTYVTGFFVPTLIGNVLGGVTLVSVLNFGQVVPDMEGNRRSDA